MNRLNMIVVAALTLGATHAQGISNSRDGAGNLVDRGAATRSYPVAPMANSAIRSTASQGYAVVAPRRTAIIRRRR
jgi:hypothetical protein